MNARQYITEAQQSRDRFADAPFASEEERTFAVDCALFIGFSIAKSLDVIATEMRKKK